MTFPTDWDVDKYRVEYESEEHWELRRRFLVAHKSKFPEDRLVCLAQVFYNVEFMGCRYPEKTMKLVAKLSQGVADEHREKMKSKLQRTFVQASDAASSKVKGCKKSKVAAQTSSTASFKKSSCPGTSNFQVLPLLAQEEKNPYNPSSKNPEKYISSDQFQPIKKMDKQKLESETFSNKKLQISKEVPNRNEGAEAGCNLKQLFSRVVILNHGNTKATGVLANSVSASKMKLKYNTNKLPSGESEVSVFINDVILSKAVKPTVSDAKLCCAKEALEKLQECCYTLIMKDRFATAIPVVEKDAQNMNEGEPGQKKGDSGAIMDHKAERMMKLMGWGGGGLGKNEQGREEPVQAVKHISRAGLGSICAESALFAKSLRKILRDFARKDDGHDLVFAADFSNTERATIHSVARKLGLKSSSYGVDPNRRLVVSVKKTAWQIVQEVLLAGGRTEKYEVISPTKN